jgi:hypothetical protein
MTLASLTACSSTESEPARLGPTHFIDWANLRNPILSVDDRCIKNQTVIFKDGMFYVFAGQRFEDGATGKRTHLYATRDFKSWETLAPDNLDKLSSSDILEVDGTFRLITQGVVEGAKAEHRLLTSTSPDLRTWASPVEIASTNKAEQRQIDGTLARADDGHFWLGYKGGQDFHVLRSETTTLDGRWSPPMPASAGGQWAEAFHFLRIDGAWHLVATAHDPNGSRCNNVYVCSHEPFLYRMDGDGSDPVHWTRWIDKRHLEVPVEPWNTGMHANSASLSDWRSLDGYFYLFYAGSDDIDSFGGRSHGKIGVMRSRDLVNWRVPGDLRE